MLTDDDVVAQYIAKPFTIIPPLRRHLAEEKDQDVEEGGGETSHRKMTVLLDDQDWAHLYSPTEEEIKAATAATGGEGKWMPLILYSPFLFPIDVDS